MENLELLDCSANRVCMSVLLHFPVHELYLPYQQPQSVKWNRKDVNFR